MRVLVMGAGALGGYFGGALAQAGHEVTLVARGPHLAALQERGLELRTPEGAARLHPIAAVAAPGQAAGPFDLVLFTVKGYDAEAAAQALRPVVGEETVVLSLLNGVESVEQLRAALGTGHVLGGTTTVRATVAAPGVVVRDGPPRPIVYGTAEPRSAARAEAIAAALRQAGVEMIPAASAPAALWQKFVFFAPHATITSAAQLPVGPIRELPEGRALYRAMIDEAVAVARAEGVPLAPDAAEQAMAFALAIPGEFKTSLQVSFERGQPVELEQVTGALVRRARAHGVPTPHFDALYAVLKARAQAAGLLKS
jgi:2-dehydropantoate 2-reductase